MDVYPALIAMSGPRSTGSPTRSGSSPACSATRARRRSTTQPSCTATRWSSSNPSVPEIPTAALPVWVGCTWPVDDVDDHYERARAAGVEVLNEPHDAMDGDQRGYSALEDKSLDLRNHATDAIAQRPIRSARPEQVLDEAEQGVDGAPAWGGHRGASPATTATSSTSLPTTREGGGGRWAGKPRLRRTVLELGVGTGESRSRCPPWASKSTASNLTRQWLSSCATRRAAC